MKKNFNPNYFGAPQLEKKYNENHGPDGKFTSSDGGGAAGHANVAKAASAGTAKQGLSQYAASKSADAEEASKNAIAKKDSISHHMAASKHDSAASVHSDLAKSAPNSAAKEAHTKAASIHSTAAASHRAEAVKQFTQGNHGSGGGNGVRTSSEGFSALSGALPKSSRLR